MKSNGYQLKSHIQNYPKQNKENERPARLYIFRYYFIASVKLVPVDVNDI